MNRNILHDYSVTGKEKQWSAHKAGSRRLAKLYKEANAKESILSPNRIADLEQCADKLFFAKLENGKQEFRYAWFCRVRLCPMCQWRRALKLSRRLYKAMKSIKEKASSTRFLFVTFTQNNCEGSELKKTLDVMNDGYKKLMKRKRLSTVVLGSVRSVEVTVNEKDLTFHPHIHSLIAVKASYFKGENYIKQDEWRSLWKSVLGLPYKPQVNVKAVDESCIAECVKYPFKGLEELVGRFKTEVAVDVLITLHKALRKRRLVSFSGVFKDFGYEENYSSVDLVHVEACSDLKTVGTVIYVWTPRAGVYVEKC